jgi:competence protein ComEC
VSHLRANALLYLAGAWLLGVVAAAASGHVWWPGVAAIGAGGLAAALLRVDLRYALIGAIAAGLFVAGGYRYVEHVPPDEPTGIALYNDAAPVRFRALVTDAPTLSGRSQRVRLSVREVFSNNDWQPSGGGVMLRTGQFPDYKYGDVLDITGKLETPPTFPDFDYREYLSMRDAQSMMQYPAVHVVATGQGNRAKAALFSVRNRLGDALERVLPEPQASLAEGIFIGQRTTIPAALTADMNSTGTSHLVAVSGENVAIVAALTISSLAWLIGRRRAAIVALLSIAAYTLLTGASPSVVRAAIMGSLFVVATLAGRPASAGASIALAAAIMVGLDPLVVHDVSFQLSFAAIVGIVYLAPAFEAYGGEMMRQFSIEPLESRAASLLIENLAITFAAITATLPLSALHFGRISIVAPAANLPLLPAFPLILASSGVTAVAAVTWEPLGTATAWFTWAALTYMIETARFFAGLPAASVRIDGFGRWHAIGAYVVIAVLLVWAARQTKTFRRDGSLLHPPMRIDLGTKPVLQRGSLLRPVWVLASVLTIASAFAWSAAFHASSGRLTVSVLDVGQGDSILIETPDGRHVLVDGGASGLVLAQRLGEELPFWERTIDLVALTHPQEDHMAGLVDALERYDVKQVVASPYQSDSAGFREWRDLIAQQQIGYHEATAGDAIDLGDGATLRVLGPDGEMLSTNDANNESLVLKLTWRNVSFLLTGDIEVEAENELLRSGADLHSTVLKVAHHGSATSSSAAFLQAVEPRLAVLSVGAHNPYGHPSPSVVQRLDEESAVLRTDEHGTIDVSTDGSHVWVEAER